MSRTETCSLLGVLAGTVFLLFAGRVALAESGVSGDVVPDTSKVSTLSQPADDAKERTNVVGKVLTVLDESYHPFPEETPDGTWLDKLDDFHDWFFLNADSYVAGTDQLFAGNEAPVHRVTNSTFSAELYMELKRNDDIEFELSPSFSADVYVPNMERKLNVYVNNIARDELPGADPMQRKDPLQIGASSAVDFLDMIDLDLSAGVKWRWPPVVFTELEWSDYMDSEDNKWHFRPGVKGFWYSDDGFGSKASMRLELWPTMESLVTTSYGARWTEESDGVEWSASAGTGMLLSGTRKDSRHVIGTRFVCSGHKSGAGVMDNYRYEVVYRRPLYNKWIFLSVTPRLEWDNDNDWNTVPSIMLGLDMYFGSVLGD